MPEREGREVIRSEVGATCSRTGCSRRISVRSCLKLYPNGEDETGFGQKLEQVVPEREGREVFGSEAGASCSRTGSSRRISVRSWSKLFPNERDEEWFGKKLAKVVPESCAAMLVRSQEERSCSRKLRRHVESVTRRAKLFPKGHATGLFLSSSSAYSLRGTSEMKTESKYRLLAYFFELPQRTGRPNIGHATGRGALPDERTGRPNIGHATG
ncbi:hypothetical protein KS419_01670, partial [Bacillus tamaricis]